MSYVGSAPSPSQVQFSTLDAQSFNGDGSTTAFTLNRAVSIAASIEVTVNNVQQSPYDGSYTVNGTTTLTFSEAPSSGTDNIYVRFLDYPLASITPADGSVGSSQLQSDLSLTGDLNLASTGARITGDFSNATVANRVMFQTSTTNGNTNLEVIPNGTATRTDLVLNNAADTTNASLAQMFISNAEMRLISNRRGTGSYLPMTFYTNGSEKMRLTTDGYLRMASGSGGIQFGGDTAAANALDDYEEGTWTPTINFDGASVGITYASNRNGYYTKIGRLVTIFCYIELTNKGSSTGTPGISGLPFTSANLTSGYTTSGSVWMYAASSLSGSLTMLLPNNSSNLSLRSITGTGDNFTISNSNFGNTTQIIVSASYYTT